MFDHITPTTFTLPLGTALTLLASGLNIDPDNTWVSVTVAIALIGAAFVIGWKLSMSQERQANTNLKVADALSTFKQDMQEFKTDMGKIRHDVDLINNRCSFNHHKTQKVEIEL